MNQELMMIAGTAASLGLVHTLIGPDHYLPFIVIAKARGWSHAKTLWITLLSGLGHILSSLAIGLLGIALGIAVTRLEWVESLRGDIAAWLLIAFGLVYTVWGLKKATRHSPHTHAHPHLSFHDHSEARSEKDGHSHEHIHDAEHVHPHGQNVEGFRITPWVLFTIFVFGPCEPLIPLVIYPAAKNDFSGAVVVAAIFGAVTVITMIAAVFLGLYGMTFFPITRIERYSHALAGFTILLCGLSIVLLGL
jgi:nickel/cobalt transporter (NicO) family protein